MAEKNRYFVLELQGSDSSWSVDGMAMAIFVSPVKFSSGGTREFSLQVTTHASINMVIISLNCNDLLLI